MPGEVTGVLDRIGARVTAPRADVAVASAGKLVMRVLAVALAGLHTVVAARQQSMNEDGINYLDLGAAYLNGDWRVAANSVWSPLYAWIVGTVVRIANPSTHWEFPLVALTNFAIFGAALVCFEFFWRQLSKRYFEVEQDVSFTGFPPAVWTLVGYSLFIWTSLHLITIWAVTPDMCVSALVYLAAGLGLRAERQVTRTSSFVLLGCVLGIGYLTKAALLPLGLVWVVLAAGAMRIPGKSVIRHITLALIPFAMIAGPLIFVLSKTSGHLTFGDVGRFTYMKHVNLLLYPYWGSSRLNVAGEPDHPPRRIHANPDVYEFAEPIGGSYPLSFDPGYWTQGLTPRFDARQQLLASLSNARYYFQLFVREQGGFAAVVLVLGVLAWQSGRLAFFSAPGALVAWALVGFAMYAVVFVSGRYIAPFVVLFWTGLLSGIKLSHSPLHGRVIGIGGVVLAAFVWVNIAAANIDGFATALGISVGLPADPVAGGEGAKAASSAWGTPPAVAEGLKQAGIHDGDRIGFIGYSFSAFWAHLARVRITAELPAQQAGSFWSAPPAAQSAVLAAFARAGVSAVVAEPAGFAAVPPGWQPVGGTDYLVRILR